MGIFGNNPLLKPSGSGGSGITDLNGLAGATQTFGNDTNVTISSSGTAHTLGWAGTLAVSRGGTGAGTLTGLLLGNGTGAVTAITTSAGIAGAISDETGSGALVFGTSPTLTTPTLGVATATSINKVAFTAPATSATLTLIDGTTVTGPAATGTLATLAGAETFTNKVYTPRVVAASDATSITPNNDTSDIVTQANTQAGGTLTINAPSGTAFNGQSMIFRIKSTNSQTYAFNAIYRGGTTALPTTHGGSSKTDYLGFIYNSGDTKWDMVALSQAF